MKVQHEVILKGVLHTFILKYKVKGEEAYGIIFGDSYMMFAVESGRNLLVNLVFNSLR